METVPAGSGRTMGVAVGAGKVIKVIKVIKFV